MQPYSLAGLRAPLRDVSRWNRLVSLPSDRASGYLSFDQPAHVIRDVLSRGERVRFTDPVLALRDDWINPDPVGLEAAEAYTRLTRLDALSRDLVEERGLSPLTLGLGQVVWRDRSGAEERGRVAPLMLCPVMLGGMPDAPDLQLAGVPVGNPVLFDRLGIDPASLPPDPLSWSAEHLVGYEVTAITTVAMLALFDLARYRQWQRLDAEIDPVMAQHPQVLRLLAGGGKGPWPQDARRAVSTDTRMTTSLDRSQAQVIDASRCGLSLAVQGGPGTGKTQAIAHILGNAATDGRSVLFLSGRLSAFRAALKRLEGSGIETVCLPLYGSDCEPRSIADRVGVEPAGTVVETLERVERRPHAVMATPASYAMHVPQAWGFDLLVVDEASLIPLAEALPAVAACGQLVICGDSQQMQKDPSLRQLYDPETPYEPAPTLIDAAVAAGIPTAVLTHHYRSRQPSLMHHTNRMAYRGLMRLSPSPFPGMDHGLASMRVAGVFDWGTKTNAVEAEAIVDEIVRHTATGSTASIGVIAMTQQQRDLIRQRIAERGLDLSPIRGAESLLVADYNGVQGEERDVVLISMTFGPRPGDSAWPTSYGAISLPGGEKRLNVIMTRARERALLVTSFPKESVNAARTLGHGRLYTYMLCAERSGSDEPAPYDGPLAEQFRGTPWRPVSLGNAIGLLGRWPGRYDAAIFPTGLLDELTERSEIAQYENAGWQVIEMPHEDVAAPDTGFGGFGPLYGRLSRCESTMDKRYPKGRQPL